MNYETPLDVSVDFVGDQRNLRHTPQPADLEQTFWACDYVATTQGINATPNECIGAYEQVKNTMFGGDFERMLDWWRQHKPVEHANLANSIMNASTGRR